MKKNSRKISLNRKYSVDLWLILGIFFIIIGIAGFADNILPLIEPSIGTSSAYLIDAIINLTVGLFILKRIKIALFAAAFVVFISGIGLLVSHQPGYLIYIIINLIVFMLTIKLLIEDKNKKKK